MCVRTICTCTAVEGEDNYRTAEAFGMEVSIKDLVLEQRLKWLGHVGGWIMEGYLGKPCLES